MINGFYHALKGFFIFSTTFFIVYDVRYFLFDDFLTFMVL